MTDIKNLVYIDNGMVRFEICEKNSIRSLYSLRLNDKSCKHIDIHLGGVYYPVDEVGEAYTIGTARLLYEKLVTEGYAEEIETYTVTPPKSAEYIKISLTAEKTLRWLDTDEAKAKVKEAQERAAKSTKEFNDSLRVRPTCLNPLGL